MSDRGLETEVKRMQIIWQFAALFLLVVFVWFFATQAFAHSWYEYQCCTERDCYPVDDPEAVKELKEGVLVRKWGMLSYSDPRLRWSLDGRMHICESSSKLHCVYRPPPAT